MTTIATDGKTMAADGRMTAGSHIVKEDTDKMFEVSVIHPGGQGTDKLIVGFAGSIAYFDDVMDFIKEVYVPEHGIFSNARFLLEPEDNETEFHTPDDTAALVLLPNGTVWLASYGEPMLRMNKTYAVGSGADYAMGAMLAGASPSAAVMIASRLDVNTNGNVTEKRHG